MQEASIIDRAKELARKAHDGQWLWNKQVNAVTAHLEETAKLVQENGGTDEEIAAAWLHDSVEDTDVSLEDIRKDFGDSVAEIVRSLTDPIDFLNYPNSVRKSMQAERIKSESDSAKLVKLADQASNCRMAGTDQRSLDIPTTIDYIDGTKKIAANCRGVSKNLDDIFDRYYEETKEKLLAQQ